MAPESASPESRSRSRVGAAGRLSLLALPGIPLVEPGDDLVDTLEQAIAAAGESLRDGDVLVLAQKIVSKAEGRYVDLREVEVSQRARELAAEVDKDPRLVEVILSESSEVVRYRPGVLIVAHRLGHVVANAGVDQSNVAQEGDDERVLLLPRDPDATAARIRGEIQRRWSTDVGVVISDSTGRAWRHGTVGIALGAAGLPALLDLRGHKDLYGRALTVTEEGLADEIAAAASLLMGQADQGTPVVLVRGVGAVGQQRASGASALLRDKKQDLFR